MARPNRESPLSPAAEKSGRRLLDPVAQLDERLLKARGVRDQVGLPAGQDRALRRAHPAQLDAEDDHPEERHGGDPGGRQRDYALSRVQIVHGARVLRRLSG